MGLVHEGFNFLYNIGFFTVFLPFLIIFVITFGLLQRVKIFGEGNYSNYNSLLSFCLAFFTIYNFAILESIPILISRISLLLLIIVILLVLGGMFNVNEVFRSSITIFVILAYFVVTVVDIYFPSATFSMNQTLVFSAVALLTFLGMIHFVTKASAKEKFSSLDNGPKKNETKDSPKSPKGSANSLPPSMPSGTQTPHLGSDMPTPRKSSIYKR